MEGTSGVLLLLSIKLSLELRVTFWQSKQSDFYLLSQYVASAWCVRVHACVFKKKRESEQKMGKGGRKREGWRGAIEDGKKKKKSSEVRRVTTPSQN